MKDQIKILDIQIDKVDFLDSLKKVEELVNTKGYHQVATVNPEFIIHSTYDKEFKKALMNSSLNTPDGIGIIWAAKYLSIKKKNILSRIFWLKVTLFAILFKKKWLMSEIGERVTGIDLMWDIAKMAQAREWRVFLLGGEEGVAEEVGEKLRTLYPRINIVGTYAGFPGEERLCARVAETKPDILFVAYGSPKQEIFIYQNLEKLKSKVTIGVGGSFDFIIGKSKRAPEWMQKMGIEWLYRLTKQPKRAMRIFNAFPRFVWRIFRDVN